ncbi:MAG: deiodinase-related protein, partial [Chloroflexota bacterium]
FNRSGIPVYKSDWSDANSVDNAITYYLDVIERRRNKERLAPFRVERLDYRDSDQEKFYAGLERNGPRAVTEFKNAF